MDKPEMYDSGEEFDYNLWYNSFDPDFIKISFESRVPRKWMSYQRVLSGPYSDSIIKPVNPYVEALYPGPELISIDNNVVRLRQRNHAEIFLLLKDDGTFRNLDRPWMRQYYNTRESYEIPETCFDGVYKFYVPWFIDEAVDVIFEPVEGSPFEVYGAKAQYSKVPKEEEYVNPKFVPFSFKRVGAHMVKENFGKIKRLVPMFDIVFQADDTIVERVRNFYAKD